MDFTSFTGSAPGSTSSGLLVRARSRDPAAWHSLARLYGPLVYQWARSSRLQPTDAADVTQEVFQSVAARIEDYHHDQPGDTFRGWLWTITRNKIRDHFRRATQRPVATGGSEAHQMLQQLPEEPPELSGSSAGGGEFEKALAQLRSEFEPQTLEMISRLLEGANVADVAAERNVSVWAVYKARSRVLRRIRELLGGSSFEDRS